MSTKDKILDVIKKRGYKVSDVATALGIDKSTLYRKLNGDVECGLTINEAKKLKSFLSLSDEEATNIFFINNVA